MELKRYVLDTQRCFIYDMQNKYDVKKFEMISKFATHFVNGACKTSDNILELRETGDLIRTWNGILIELTERLIKEALREIDIIHLFKRQPNGDYKRYEVQK